MKNLTDFRKTVKTGMDLGPGFVIPSRYVIAAHPGVFRGARFSFLPRREGGKTSFPKLACVGG